MLRTAGESGFDMDELKSQAYVLGGVMAMLQLVPLYADLPSHLDLVSI